MKKLYSLVAVAMFSTAAFSQAVFTADFNDLNGTGGNDGVWNGNVGTSSLTTYTNAGWSFTSAGGASQSIKAGSGSAAGVIITPALSALTGDAVVTFRAGSFGTDSTVLSVSVTGGGAVDVSNFTLTNGQFNSYTFKLTGGTSASKLTFSSSAKSKRFFLDDIVVMPATTLAVVNTDEKKLNFLKSTVVDGELVFGVKADVKIYDMNGRMLKAASVNNGTSMDGSSFAKGIYIVSGEAEGQKITAKIIKR